MINPFTIAVAVERNGKIKKLKHHSAYTHPFPPVHFLSYQTSQNQAVLGGNWQSCGNHGRAEMRWGSVFSLSPLGLSPFLPSFFAVGCSIHIHIHILLESLKKKETLSVYTCNFFVHSDHLINNVNMDINVKFAILSTWPSYQYVKGWFFFSNGHSQCGWMTVPLEIGCPYYYIIALLETSLSYVFYPNYLFR